MTLSERGRRILIVSSYPLFRTGLSRLVGERESLQAQVIGLANTIEEAVTALTTLAPDLVIVGYDDEVVKRKEFLAHFVESEGPLRVVLIPLKESNTIVVYDRHILAPTQKEDWLEAALTLTG